MPIANFKYMTSDGEKSGQVSLEDYRKASNVNMTLTAYVNAKYPNADPRYGTAFTQAKEYLGIHLTNDPSRGIRSTTVQEMMDGTPAMQAAGEGLSRGGNVVQPSQQGDTPASRVFFPEVVMGMLNEILQTDYSLEEATWANMQSSNETISQEMFTQPYINIEAPGGTDSSPIGQLSLPKNLVSITTSQTSKRIPTYSVGLQISDEAVRSATLDLVGTILTKQAKEEGLRRMWTDIANAKNGNVDAGEVALPSQAITDFDAGVGAGEVTQLAWIKMLYDPDRKIAIDSAVMDIDTYLAIEGRTGRPLIYDPTTGGSNAGNAGNYGLNANPNVLNVQLGVPNVLIVPTAYIGAKTMMMFDSSIALRRVTNATASYSAIEKMVLQRGTYYRFDWGRMAYRLFDDAFRVVTLT